MSAPALKVRPPPINTIAVALAASGHEYVIYVADSREIYDVEAGYPCSGLLTLTLPPGSYRVRLFSPTAGRYVTDERDVNGGNLTLELDRFSHDIVVHVRASLR